MRTIEEVERVLELATRGLNPCQISRETRIPRATVRDWCRGKIPTGRRPLAGNRVGSCPECGHPNHEFDELPQAQYSYLLGLYLGDGYISRSHRGVFRLRIVLDRRYPGIIRECARAMATVMPSSKVGIFAQKHMNADEVSSYSRAWPCLFPQHGPGRKHLREIRLMDWQQRLVDRHPEPMLRGLIHSDGCYSVNTIKHPKKTYVYPRYLFSNRSDDIRRIFCETCDRLGIAWRAMNQFEISVAQRESIALMDEFIGPKNGCSAGGGIRTHKPLRARPFESRE